MRIPTDPIFDHERIAALALAWVHADEPDLRCASASILATATQCAALEILPTDLVEECSLLDALQAIRSAAPTPKLASNGVVKVAVFDLDDPFSDLWLHIGRWAVRYWEKMK